MQEITYDSLPVRLVEAVPEFAADPEYVKDKLNYPLFNDLARFINSLLGGDKNEGLLQRIFNFIEEAAGTQDQGIIEVLRDSFNELAIRNPDKAESYMGRHTQRIFEDVKEEVYGGPVAIRKASRSIKRLRGKP